MLAFAATVAFAWWFKARCVYHHWDGYQYDNYCYSDVEAVYVLREFSEGVFPYVHSFIEYPIVTGVYVWTVAAIAGSKVAYIHWNAAFMTVAAAATLATMVKWQGWRPRVLLWAMAPPLAWYAFYNWEMLAIALSTAGLYAFHRGRVATGGALVAAGAMAKIYPAVFLPMMGLALLQDEEGLGRKGWRFGLAAVGTLVAINLPFAVLNRPLWAETYTFHLERHPNLESIWFIIGDLGRRWDLGYVPDHLADTWAGPLGLILLLGGLGLFGTLVRRGRLDWLTACLGVLALFMATNKVQNLQYTLWIVPLLPLLAVPGRRVAALFIADGLTFWALFRYFQGDNGADPFSLVALCVVLRFLSVVWVLVWAWQQRQPAPVVDAPDTPNPTREPVVERP